jgi:hypothetical protein
MIRRLPKRVRLRAVKLRVAPSAFFATSCAGELDIVICRA